MLYYRVRQLLCGDAAVTYLREGRLTLQGRVDEKSLHLGIGIIVPDKGTTLHYGAS